MKMKQMKRKRQHKNPVGDMQSAHGQLGSICWPKSLGMNFKCPCPSPSVVSPSVGSSAHTCLEIWILKCSLLLPAPHPSPGWVCDKEVTLIWGEVWGKGY